MSIKLLIAFYRGETIVSNALFNGAASCSVKRKEAALSGSGSSLATDASLSRVFHPSESPGAGLRSCFAVRLSRRAGEQDPCTRYAAACRFLITGRGAGPPNCLSGSSSVQLRSLQSRTSASRSALGGYTLRKEKTNL